MCGALKFFFYYRQINTLSKVLICGVTFNFGLFIILFIHFKELYANKILS